MAPPESSDVMIRKPYRRPPPPQDEGWSWMIVIGVFIYSFMMIGIGKSYGLFLLEFVDTFQVSVAYASLPLSVSAIVYGFGAPSALLISERFTARRVVIVGALIGFFGMVVSSFAVSMLFITIFFGIFQGLGNSTFYGNGLVMIGKYFDKRRSLATGLGLAGASVGQFALPPFIEYLMETYGLGGTLLIMSGLYFHTVISGALFRPLSLYGPREPAVEDIKEREAMMDGKDEVEAAETKVFVDVADDQGYPTLEGSAVDDAKTPNDKETIQIMDSNLSEQDVKEKVNKAEKTGCCCRFVGRLFDFSVLRSYVTQYYTAVCFTAFFGYFNYVLFLPAVLSERGIKSYDGAFMISLCGVGDLISRVTTGFFADLNIIPRYQISAIACMLCSLTIIAVLPTTNQIALSIFVTLYGYLGGAYVSLLSVTLVDFVGLELMSKNLAVILLFQGTGAAVGQVFMGWLKDVTGSFDIVLIICFTCLMSGGIMHFFLPFFKRREKARLAKITAQNGPDL